MNETHYLLVYDISAPVCSASVELLGLEPEATFEDLRQHGDPYNGYFMKKDGQSVWVLPFYADPRLGIEEDPGVVEELTKAEFLAVEFDPEEE